MDDLANHTPSTSDFEQQTQQEQPVPTQQEARPAQTMFTMHLKPKQPEKYDGKRDVQVIDNWTASVDSYFALTGAQPPAVFYYLNTIFTKDAASWFRFNFRNANPTLVTWEVVKEMLVKHFVPVNHRRQLRDDWAYTRQTGTVKEYYSHLAQLAMQIGTINEVEFLDKFVRGLKAKTKMEVIFRNPKTLDEALELADNYDSAMFRKAFNNFQPNFDSSWQGDTRGEPMHLDTLRSTSTDTRSAIQIDSFKTKSREPTLQKLSESERTRLRDIGACFKCRKQGHMARECTSKVFPNSGNGKRQ
jgi:hypothetical protein